MQSGAFLQLVLTVLALVSRLGTISFEVLEALQATSETIRCIVEAVSVCFFHHSVAPKSPTSRRHLKSDA